MAVVCEDSMNARAWWLLAHTIPLTRRANLLKKVVELDSNHDKAREQLQSIEADTQPPVKQQMEEARELLAKNEKIKAAYILILIFCNYPTQKEVRQLLAQAVDNAEASDCLEETAKVIQPEPKIAPYNPPKPIKGNGSTSGNGSPKTSITGNSEENTRSKTTTETDTIKLKSGGTPTSITPKQTPEEERIEAKKPNITNIWRSVPMQWSATISRPTIYPRYFPTQTLG